MCGITGYIVPSTIQPYIKRKKTQEFLWNYIGQSLIKMSRTRGTDGTGIAFIENNQLHVLKDNISATDFVKTKSFKQLVNRMPNIMIGHVRRRSTGNKDLNNTHPIIKGNWALVHNGTVSNVKLAKEKLRGKYKAKTDLDSEVIINTIKYLVDVKNISMHEAVHSFVNFSTGGQACALIRADQPTKLYLWKGYTGSGSNIHLVWHRDRRILTFITDTSFVPVTSKFKHYGWNIFKIDISGRTMTREIKTEEYWELDCTHNLTEDVKPKEVKYAPKYDLDGSSRIKTYNTSSYNHTSTTASNNNSTLHNKTGADKVTINENNDVRLISSGTHKKNSEAENYEWRVRTARRNLREIKRKFPSNKQERLQQIVAEYSQRDKTDTEKNREESIQIEDMGIVITRGMPVYPKIIFGGYPCEHTDIMIAKQEFIQ